ncbi:MAG: hypothetical protein ACK55I_14235, partial [bacterium]
RQASWLGRRNAPVNCGSGAPMVDSRCCSSMSRASIRSRSPMTAACSPRRVVRATMPCGNLMSPDNAHRVAYRRVVAP